MEENNHIKEEQEPSSFKFNVDDEVPDFINQTKRRNKPLEKKASATEKKGSGGRLFSVLLFFLMGVILFVLYLDLRERIDKTYHTKTTAVENLSKELENKISSLSVRYKKIDTALIEKISPMDEILVNLEGTLTSLKEGMKKAEQNIEKFGEFHAEKKELENKVEQIEKSLGPVQENLKKVETAIKSLDEKFTKDMTALSETLNQAKEDFANLVSKDADESNNGQDNETAAELSANWIEKEAFELALENQQRLYQNKIDLLIENLATKEEKIQTIGTKLQELEKQIKSFEKKPAASQEAKSPEPEPTKEKAAHESAVIHPIDKIKPKPGTFVEQDIE